MIWLHVRNWGDEPLPGLNFLWANGPYVELCIGRHSWSIWLSHDRVWRR